MERPPTTSPDLERLLRERRWLRRLAGTLVVDAAQADDLSPEALRIALSRRSPELLRHPRAWLATVACRLLGRDAAAAQSRNERERAVEQAAANVAAGGGARLSAAALALSGALWMSAKLKLAAAALAVAGGSWAIVELTRAPGLSAPPRVAAHEAGAREVAEPVAPPLAAPIEAERADATSFAASAERAVEPAVATPAPIALDGIVLHGDVRDLRGEPIVDASVIVMAWSGDGPQRSGRSLCGLAVDAAGRYRCRSATSASPAIRGASAATTSATSS
ncbi:MAG: hypothetical protein EXS13_09155 [Planctomycetes bacterium]|nr:hypothetical protein [Planctomycetota bacterium]